MQIESAYTHTRCSRQIARAGLHINITPAIQIQTVSARPVACYANVNVDVGVCPDKSRETSMDTPCMETQPRQAITVATAITSIRGGQQEGSGDITHIIRHPSTLRNPREKPPSSSFSGSGSIENSTVHRTYHHYQHQHRHHYSRPICTSRTSRATCNPQIQMDAPVR